MCELTDIVRDTEFKVFNDVLTAGGSIAALNAKGCAKYSRKDTDNLIDLAKRYGAKGLSIIKCVDGKFESPIAKYMPETIQIAILKKTAAESGDLLLIAADECGERCHTILGQVRLEMRGARKYWKQ